MSRPVLVAPKAEDEVIAAYLWYERQSPIAAARFLQALDRAMKQVSERPDSFPAYLAGARSCQLHKFPYLVIFRVHPAKIDVIAIAHGHRKPGYWRDRLTK